ncbi:hypothetical protein GX563_03270 [Candidatus Bathyarchaeota archaeon]|nr:hypothetical protein [Candidatus Bathyarchaeota archaeon]
MRVPERYLLSLTVTYAVTTFLLSFYGSSTLDLYVSVYIVEYFILTLLNSPLTPKTQRVTNVLGYTLFAVFIVIVGLKVLEILGASFI